MRRNMSCKTSIYQIKIIARHTALYIGHKTQMKRELNHKDYMEIGNSTFSMVQPFDTVLYEKIERTISLLMTGCI